MKPDTHDPSTLVPRKEREILDQIRNDHELIERLKITPQELETLSKCALLGTLSSKQDMLFILRQIREASDPEIDPAAVALRRAPREQEYEEPAVNFPRVPVRVAPVIIPDPASLGDITRRRVPAQFGVLFWSIVLAAGLAWKIF